MNAKLFLIATPIGNLSDISFRAIETLKSVDLLCCEDKRVTAKLLNYYEISVPMRVYHDHNKERQTPKIIAELQSGKTVGLVTDAGMPGISDPAFYLVRAAISENIEIITIPGASAGITALVASGLPTDRFVFEGFLPRKKGRQTRLKNLADEERTIIFYESPHRIERLLGEILEFLGDKQVVIARELTKIHESFYRGTANELKNNLHSITKKGEFVVMVGKGKSEKA